MGRYETIGLLSCFLSSYYRSIDEPCFFITAAEYCRAPLTHDNTENFFAGFHQLGLITPKDPGSGAKNGVFWGPSSLDPKSESRSDARTAYYDPSVSRSNYHLLTGSAVGKIVFTGKKAQAVQVCPHDSAFRSLILPNSKVQFTDRTTLQKTTVQAKKEIIVAAGAGHTPQILQLSGVGPKTLLRGLGISVVADLPGVGSNFQDQPTLYPSYNCKSIPQGSPYFDHCSPN